MSRPDRDSHMHWGTHPLELFMPIVVPTTYDGAFKNTCPEKRTVTQTHAFTVKVRMRVRLECSLHPGARSAKYGCKSGVPVLTPGGTFLPNSGSLYLLLGRISRNSRFLSLLLGCNSRSGVCGDIVVWCAGNYSPQTKSFQKILPKLKTIQIFKKHPTTIRKLLTDYSPDFDPSRNYSERRRRARIKLGKCSKLFLRV